MQAASAKASAKPPANLLVKAPAKAPAKASPKPPINPSNIKTGLKRVLLVGINYIENEQNTLYGCINDVLNMDSKIRKAYPECKEFRSLLDNQLDPLKKPTRKNILDSINWLTTGLMPGESVLFHYSGHGGLTVDYSGDEKGGYDSCIYPIQNGTIECITDDELRNYLVNKIPADCKCFAILDCCHSGSALDLRYIYNAPNYGTLTISQNESYSKTKGSVIFLSGCKDTQTAADTVDKKNIPSGALTNALLQVWDKYGLSIKFKYLLWDVRVVLKEGGYDQIPQLSCSNTINLSDLFKL